MAVKILQERSKQSVAFSKLPHFILAALDLTEQNGSVLVPLINLPLLLRIIYGGHADKSAPIFMTPAPDLQGRAHTKRSIMCVCVCV